MKKLLLFISIAVSTLSIEAQVKKVLFLGNSYTYYNNLPQQLSAIAQSFGDSVYTNQHTPGGNTFSNHASNTTSINKINQDQWDFVVLQEQSQIPALPQSITGNDHSPPHAITLNNLIKNNYSCTETVFFMTWGRKNGDASFCGQHPPVCTYAGMQQELRNSYLSMAITNSATVAPVGVAWKMMRDSFPSIDLYAGDGSHPSIYGSYLAACVFYTTLFQKTSVGTPYIPVGITAGEALNIQTIASKTVLDSMGVWRINANHPVANFYYSGGGTINFTNTSTNGQTYSWNFGDGNNSTNVNPSHSYLNNGNYNVTLIVYSQDSCFTDTITQNVSIIKAGINSYTSENIISIYPNPVNDFLILKSTENYNSVRIYDGLGRLVLTTLKKQKLNISQLPKGVYMLQIDNKMNSRLKFVKH